MLDDYHSRLKEDEKTIDDNNLGCHYRWPGWIDSMNKYRCTKSISKKQIAR